MISIITAIHNQLEVNKIFYNSLKKSTFNSFELIILDNNSTDGSSDYFAEKRFENGNQWCEIFERKKYINMPYKTP